jgi:hypothetical protein
MTWEWHRPVFADVNWIKWNRGIFPHSNKNCCDNVAKVRNNTCPIGKNWTSCPVKWKLIGYVVQSLGQLVALPGIAGPLPCFSGQQPGNMRHFVWANNLATKFLFCQSGIQYYFLFFDSDFFVTEDRCKTHRQQWQQNSTFITFNLLWITMITRNFDMLWKNRRWHWIQREKSTPRIIYFRGCSWLVLSSFYNTIINLQKQYYIFLKLV